MKKLAKIAAAIVAVVVVLLIILVVLAKVVITPERIKETVLPLAEKSLQRKIELGDIRVSLFSGIELRALKVYEPDGSEVFVSTDLVRLRYQLLPLLAMKVVIDEVTVEKPQIRIVRLPDGRFSFDDILGGVSAQESQRREPGAGSSSGSTPIALLVSKVRVADGSVDFFDQQFNPKAPFRIELRAVQVEASGITLTGRVPLHLSCQVNGGTVAMDGSVSLVGPAASFKVKLADLDVMAYAPYFKAAVPGKLNGLVLNLETTLDGSAKQVTAAGSLQGQGLNLVLEALKDAPIQDARFRIDYDLDYDLQGGAVTLRSTRVDFNGLVAEASGKVQGVQTRPVLDLQFSVPALDLQQALQSVPTALVDGVKELQPAGTVVVSAQLAGSPDDPVKLLRRATVALNNVQISGGGHRPALNGKLNLADGTMRSEGLVMQLGDNRAAIDLTASNLFGKIMIVQADVTSEQFLLEPLLGAGGAAGVAASGGSGKGGQTAKAEALDELGPFELPVQANGTLQVGKALYKELAIDDFVAKYQLKDNVLTFSRLDGRIAGGSFANTARIDLGTKGFAYSADLGIQSIQADPLLRAFVPQAAGTLLGAMNLSLQMSGRGTQWESLSKKLSGQGDVLLADGRVISPELVKGFATFLQLPNLDEIRFSNFEGNVKIVDGKVQVNSTLISDNIKLFPRGTIGLDGTLNLSMDTRLSPQVTARLDSRAKVSPYLSDQEGWSQLPLLVTGSYAAPKFGLDPKGVQAQATKAIGKELGRQIDKLLGGDKAAPAPQEGQPAEAVPQEEADPGKKLLQDSLKKLFGN